MIDFKECPLGGRNCDYTDDQVLSFMTGDVILKDEKKREGDISLDECRTIFCPIFRHRLIRLVKEDERKKPVVNLGRIRRMEELNEDFEDFTLH